MGTVIHLDRYRKARRAREPASFQYDVLAVLIVNFACVIAIGWLIWACFASFDFG